MLTLLSFFACTPTIQNIYYDSRFTFHIDLVNQSWDCKMWELVSCKDYGDLDRVLCTAVYL